MVDLISRVDCTGRKVNEKIDTKRREIVEKAIVRKDTKRRGIVQKANVRKDAKRREIVEKTIIRKCMKSKGRLK